jgi:hypothetical protein
MYDFWPDAVLDILASMDTFIVSYGKEMKRDRSKKSPYDSGYADGIIEGVDFIRAALNRNYQRCASPRDLMNLIDQLLQSYIQSAERTFDITEHETGHIEGIIAGTRIATEILAKGLACY